MVSGCRAHPSVVVNLGLLVELGNGDSDMCLFSVLCIAIEALRGYSPLRCATILQDFTKYCGGY